MRIKRIGVRKLFGVFDHAVELRTTEHVTIVHGPNGIGKTILLTMLAELFNGRLSYLLSIPFEELKVEFTDRSNIRVCRGARQNDKARQPPRNSLVFHYSRGRAKPYQMTPITPAQLGVPTSWIERRVPGLQRTGRRTWYNRRTHETLDLHEVAVKYGEYLPSSYRKVHTPPSWLQRVRDTINVRFIQTQRLQVASPPEHEDESPENSHPVSAVGRYANELSLLIRRTLAEHGALSQKLDSSFPKRLLERRVSQTAPVGALRRRFANTESKRRRLMEAGLISEDTVTDFEVPQDVTPENKAVLTVWTHDATRKLAVFDWLATKIEAFRRIVNQRFLHKRMAISEDKGFYFICRDGSILPPSSLSSGEQHEVILMYELLFRIEPGTLVLIDEPELSLHVAWQLRFLDDLLAVAKLSKFDVLLATHSPQIINERWHLADELSGPAD